MKDSLSFLALTMPSLGRSIQSNPPNKKPLRNTSVLESSFSLNRNAFFPTSILSNAGKSSRHSHTQTPLSSTTLKHIQNAFLLASTKRNFANPISQPPNDSKPFSSKEAH